MQLSIFSSEERPASPSASPDYEREWLTRVVRCCSPIWRLLADIGPAGWSGRMSPARCRLTEEGLLLPCSEEWQSSGMGSPTEFLTLNTSEWTALPEQFLSDDGVCSLSDILETGDVPLRYFLSATACRGILRRAEKRGRELPTSLHMALESRAEVPDGRPTGGPPPKHSGAVQTAIPPM